MGLSGENPERALFQQILSQRAGLSGASQK